MSICITICIIMYYYVFNNKFKFSIWMKLSAWVALGIISVTGGLAYWICWMHITARPSQKNLFCLGLCRTSIAPISLRFSQSKSIILRVASTTNATKCSPMTYMHKLTFKRDTNEFQLAHKCRNGMQILVHQMNVHTQCFIRIPLEIAIDWFTTQINWI